MTNGKRFFQRWGPETAQYVLSLKAKIKAACGKIHRRSWVYTGDKLGKSIKEWAPGKEYKGVAVLFWLKTLCKEEMGICAFKIKQRTKHFGYNKTSIHTIRKETLYVKLIIQQKFSNWKSKLHFYTKKIFIHSAGNLSGYGISCQMVEFAVFTFHINKILPPVPGVYGVVRFA